MPPKKAAKKHDLKHHQEKDLRRAYEHLNRVEILQRLFPAADQPSLALANLAREEAAAGNARGAADLLRAAEHLGFARLSGSQPEDAGASPAIVAALKHEFDHLKSKAEEHWEDGKGKEAIAEMYRSALHLAEKARKQASYHAAMEFIRAAEALAHVEPEARPGKRAPGKLKTATALRELSAS